jgi:Transglutaminase-like superfamily
VRGRLPALWCDANLGSVGSTAARRSTTTNARLFGIPSGEAGAKVTMRAMRLMVLDAVRDPQQGVRETALAIIAGTSNYVDQVRRIQQWVQDHITYVRDPPDVELVQTPQYTLQKKAGDCDDQSVTVGALLQSAGHPVQFMAVGLNGGPLSHVLTRTKIGTQWVAVETILKKPLGWLPPGITKHYLLDV